MSDDVERYVSRAEAAHILGVSVDTLDNYRRDGLIRGYRVRRSRVRHSRLVRFRVSDVLSLLVPEPESVAESAPALRAVDAG